MEMLSVVPRVADAQPRHGVTIAAANNSLIIDFVPPGATFTQPFREINRLLAVLLWRGLTAGVAIATAAVTF
jgi:hypothetical protein